MTDRIADVWGERTPFGAGGDWPERVDQFLTVDEDRVDRWVQSACVLCSNGCGMDVAVADGRIAGVRGRALDRVNRWSPRKQSYTMYPGTDDLDAAVLLMARTAFCHDDQQRLCSTIDAIRTELAATGPLIYHYSGMREKEGAFAACTFWLAEALALTGQNEQGSVVFDAMLGYCNDVGLLAEEIDPATGHFLGNFPQGLSHLALIGAAHALAEAP